MIVSNITRAIDSTHINLRFLKAIRNGNCIHWPDFTPTVVEIRHLPTIASAKGHINQERKLLQSTKVHQHDEITISSQQTNFYQFLPMNV